jgi:hypothetical protein
MKKAKAKKATKAKKAKTAKMKAAAAHPKGCCTIAAPGVPDRDIPGVTKAECDAIADAHPGSVANWVEGSCA